MNHPAPPDTRHDIDARRLRARRTALVFGVLAVAVYVGFLALGALAQ